MKYIYHGTTQKGIEILKPQKRYTPGGEGVADDIPARIYATYVPHMPLHTVFHGLQKMVLIL